MTESLKSFATKNAVLTYCPQCNHLTYFRKYECVVCGKKCDWDITQSIKKEREYERLRNKK